MKFEPFQLVHKTYGTCYLTRISDAVVLDRGKAFRVQSHPRRLPRDGWRKTFLLASFDGDPAILNEVHRRLHVEWLARVNRRNERAHRIDAERARRERPRSAYVGGLS